MSRRVNTKTSANFPIASGDSFAHRLNDRLDGTTSEAFARRVDVTLRTVQRWRSGESKPNGADLLRIARELDCDPAALYPLDGRDSA